MASLVDLAKDPTKRRAIVEDAAALLNAEVADKRGFSGKAVKLAFRAVKGVSPGMIPMSIDALLDDFCVQVQPFWESAQNSGQTTRVYFNANSSAIANALLSITDGRAKRSHQRVLRSAYSKLRGQAVKHISDSMTRLADLVERHAS
jgi:hypothetical protein